MWPLTRKCTTRAHARVDHAQSHVACRRERWSDAPSGTRWRSRSVMGEGFCPPRRSGLLARQRHRGRLFLRRRQQLLRRPRLPPSAVRVEPVDRGTEWAVASKPAFVPGQADTAVNVPARQTKTTAVMSNTFERDRDGMDPGGGATGTGGGGGVNRGGGAVGPVAAVSSSPGEVRAPHDPQDRFAERTSLPHKGQFTFPRDARSGAVARACERAEDAFAALYATVAFPSGTRSVHSKELSNWNCPTVTLSFTSRKRP